MQLQTHQKITGVWGRGNGSLSQCYQDLKTKQASAADGCVTKAGSQSSRQPCEADTVIYHYFSPEESESTEAQRG